MKKKQIIINADGFGFTAGTTRGTMEAIEQGVISSISVNSNTEHVLALKEFIERNPKVSVGVHVNPVVGKPIADPKDIPSLVDEHGEMHYESFTDKLQSGHIKPDEMALELGLQIERVQKLVPVVTHIDSHQNRHLWPKFFRVFLQLAKKYKIPRMRTHAHTVCMEYPNRRLMAAAFYLTHPYRMATHGFARHLMRTARRAGMRMCDRQLSVGAWGQKGRKAMLDVWLQVARNCPPGTNEIYCHPAYIDDELRKYAKVIVDQREDERRVMTNPVLREEFERNGVEIISFHDI